VIEYGLTLFDLSHPIHPATVHFPIAFFTLANVLNLIYGVSLFAPALLPFSNDKANTGAITILGYFLNVAGILSSVPAVLTGFAELYTLYSTRGLYIQDAPKGKKTLDPIVRITLMHVGSSKYTSLYACY
jgi:uncharacterized membrane protein